jgi:mRNA interferase RelE/StbE
LEYNITYKSSVKKDLKKIDKKELLKILNAIEDELKKDPFIGKELKGQFEGLFSYRIGKYRIIYTIVGNTIIILRISHRKDVYK